VARPHRRGEPPGAAIRAAVVEAGGVAVGVVLDCALVAVRGPGADEPSGAIPGQSHDAIALAPDRGRPCVLAVLHQTGDDALRAIPAAAPERAALGVPPGV